MARLLPGGGEAVLPSATDPDPVIRYAVAQHLRRESPTQCAALLNLLMQDSDPAVRAAAASAVSRASTGEVTPKMIRALVQVLVEDPSASMREYAALTLGRLSIPRQFVEPVLSALTSMVDGEVDLRVQVLALEALMRTRHPRALDVALRLVATTPNGEDQDTLWRVAAWLFAQSEDAGVAALARNAKLLEAVMNSALAEALIYVSFVLCEEVTVIGAPRQPLLDLLRAVTTRAASGWESHAQMFVDHIQADVAARAGPHLEWERWAILDTPNFRSLNPHFTPPFREVCGI
ncbi:HEAT repeat domain-containing protein [Nocardia sp. N2S4-5]|uniref:HEAT repeat domain-containing protein n=1 Tax=Nocardia sp. N2S4-5 TaxID=3351565 RepID=UPI0037D296BE